MTGADAARYPGSHLGRVEPCCWVTAMGANGRPPVYCDTESMPGLPYCPVHAKAAYPAVKRRLRENASMGGDD